MKILAIETSCDDTGIAVLEIKENKNSPEFNVLSNVVASQVEMGKKYGGVYPMMAKREHIKNLPIVFKKALKEAKISKPEKEINLIAVTNGPGLEPCLWTGINFAKDLAIKLNVPIIPINHIEAHILVNFLHNSNVIPGLTRNPGASGKTLDSGFRQNNTIKFPAVCLVVSGGHTQLILMKKIPACRQAGASYKILGETRDDAAGECFDKCARILGLGYPGGPIISQLAEKNVGLPMSPEIKLPRPMINTKDYDFSFSGLKTAVLYSWQKLHANHKTSDSVKYDLIKKEMAAEIQQAVIDVLIKKTMKAVKDFGAKSIILGGGVSANSELRKQFSENFENIIFPEANLSTDNGLMITVAGWFNRNKKVSPSSVETIKANGNLRIEK